MLAKIKRSIETLCAFIDVKKNIAAKELTSEVFSLKRFFTEEHKWTI